MLITPSVSPRATSGTKIIDCVPMRSKFSGSTPRDSRLATNSGVSVGTSIALPRLKTRAINAVESSPIGYEPGREPTSGSSFGSAWANATRSSDVALSEVDVAGLGEARHDHAGHPLEDLLSVERRREERPRLGEQPQPLVRAALGRDFHDHRLPTPVISPVSPCTG